MGRLAPGKLIEVGFWLGFALLAYAFTYSFDREIEIYRFGASGWPRAVILLLALAAICQLTQSLLRPEAPGEETEQEAGPSAPGASLEPGYALRVALTLLLPLIYASMLDYTGFYVTTPLFLALYLFVIGERRIKFLILVPLFIYLLLLLFFTKLLYVNLPVGNWHPFYDISNWLLVQLR